MSDSFEAHVRRIPGKHPYSLRATPTVDVNRHFGRYFNAGPVRLWSGAGDHKVRTEILVLVRQADDYDLVHEHISPSHLLGCSLLPHVQFESSRSGGKKWRDISRK